MASAFSSSSFFLAISLLLSPVIRLNAQEAPLPNPSFEKGDKQPDGWTTQGDVTFDENDKVEGKRSLHFKRDPVNLPPTQAFSDKFKISSGIWEFGGATKCHLYSPDVSFNTTVRVHLYDNADAEVEQKDLVIATGTSSWTRFKERIEVPSNVAAASIAIEFEKTHGEFWIDDLSIRFAGNSVPMEGGDRRTVFKTSRAGCMFYPGDRVKMEMTVETPAQLSGEGLNFTWELTDYWSERLAAQQKGALSADGKAQDGWNKYRATLDLSKLPLSAGPYYEVHTFVNLGAPSRARDKMSFAVLPESSTHACDPMAVPFGAHTWDATTYEYFPLSARLGLRRCLVFWDWPAQAPYTPQFDNGYGYDSRLGWPKKFAMIPYGVAYPGIRIEHREAGGADYSEEALREGVRQSIEKYGKQGLWGFQIGDEPPSWNAEMVKKDVETYKTIYEAIKKADPAFVAIGSAIGPNEEFFKAGFQKYQDAYNVHVYNDLSELRKEMREYRDLFAKYGGKKPIWSTEIGSNSQGLTRDVIAKDLVRKVVCFFADGGGFFTWFATGGSPDPKGQSALNGYSDSMNLFDSKYDMFLPRLDAVAYYHIINAICVKKFVKEVDYPGGVDGFLFRDKDSNCLLVFWNTKAGADFFVPLPAVHNVTVTHYDGHESRLDAGGKGINLRITDDPVMITFRGKSDSIPSALQPAQLSLAEIPENITQGREFEIVARLGEDSAAVPKLSLPPLWEAVGQPAKSKAQDGAALMTYHIAVPGDSVARVATFKLTSGQKGGPGNTELLFGIPVKSKVEVNLAPLAADTPGKAAIQLSLTNNSDKAEAVTWNVELINESQMQNGTYDFGTAKAPGAFFTGVAHDKATIEAQSVAEVTLGIANIDRLSIYKVRATAFDSNGNSVVRERLIGGFAKVPRATGKITIDGSLDEEDWRKAPAYAIDEARQVFRIEQDAKPWGGTQDLSGTLRLLWDDEYLYVGVEVTDDIFCNPFQDTDIWRGDSLQFLINPFRQEAQGKGRYDYAMGCGVKGNQVSCHLSADASMPTGLVSDIKLATRRLDPKNGNMTYEIAIPWRRLAPFKQKPGADLGLAMILNENDGEGRKSFMGWFGGVHLKETDFVGDVILAK
jgi:hypothetical protein